MTTQLNDEPAAASAHDQVAVANDELGRLAQLLAQGFGDKSSDTAQ